jgi:hypothetical protein
MNRLTLLRVWNGDHDDDKGPPTPQQPPGPLTITTTTADDDNEGRAGAGKVTTNEAQARTRPEAQVRFFSYFYILYIVLTSIYYRLCIWCTRDDDDPTSTLSLCHHRRERTGWRGLIVDVSWTVGPQLGFFFSILFILPTQSLDTTKGRADRRGRGQSRTNDKAMSLWHNVRHAYSHFLFTYLTKFLLISSYVTCDGDNIWFNSVRQRQHDRHFISNE